MARTVLKAPHEGIWFDDVALKWPLLGSPKYDGLRLFATPEGLFTSRLKTFRNISLWAHLSGLIDLCQETDSCFDAELWSRELPFRTLSGNLRSITQKVHPSIKAYVFDCIPFDAWKDATTRTVREGFMLRYELYLDLISSRDPDNVIPVRQERIGSPIEAKVFMANCVNDGYEGIMLRSPTAPYKFGRATIREGIIFKFKAWITFEATIGGFVERMEMTEDYKDSDRERDEQGFLKRSRSQDLYEPSQDFGAFVLIGDNGPFAGKLFRAKLGRGMKKVLEQNGISWGTRDRLLNRRVEVKSQRVGAWEKPRLSHIVRFLDL